MAIFLYRLNPPRPTFPADITAEEGAVADPKGAYGIAVLSVANEPTARAVCAADPAITANLGFTFALCVMPNAVAKGVDA